ncbi:serine/arginine repetitive matrix protein 2-like [Schistocerca gregaria]|uniref:serine/arginine repetitive matrix protein 2-like n=1 Tax=Schistocerca gregaria TaxID=7010 RepID=UPI00211F2D1D|nr:serine/arginine repetitive matrix protein 2-like [Schistocerca gregaria]
MYLGSRPLRRAVRVRLAEDMHVDGPCSFVSTNVRAERHLLAPRCLHATAGGRGRRPPPAPEGPAIRPNPRDSSPFLFAHHSGGPRPLLLACVPPRTRPRRPLLLRGRKNNPNAACQKSKPARGGKKTALSRGQELTTQRSIPPRLGNPPPPVTRRRRVSSTVLEAPQKIHQAQPHVLGSLLLLGPRSSPRYRPHEFRREQQPRLDILETLGRRGRLLSAISTQRAAGPKLEEEVEETVKSRPVCQIFSPSHRARPKPRHRPQQPGERLAGNQGKARAPQRGSRPLGQSGRLGTQQRPNALQLGRRLERKGRNSRLSRALQDRARHRPPNRPHVEQPRSDVHRSRTTRAGDRRIFRRHQNRPGQRRAVRQQGSGISSQPKTRSRARVLRAGHFCNPEPRRTLGRPFKLAARTGTIRAGSANPDRAPRRKPQQPIPVQVSRHPVHPGREMDPGDLLLRKSPLSRPQKPGNSDLSRLLSQARETIRTGGKDAQASVQPRRRRLSTAGKPGRALPRAAAMERRHQGARKSSRKKARLRRNAHEFGLPLAARREDPASPDALPNVGHAQTGRLVVPLQLRRRPVRRQKRAPFQAAYGESRQSEPGVFS